MAHETLPFFERVSWLLLERKLQLTPAGKRMIECTVISQRRDSTERKHAANYVTPVYSVY